MSCSNCKYRKTSLSNLRTRVHSNLSPYEGFRTIFHCSTFIVLQNLRRRWCNIFFFLSATTLSYWHKLELSMYGNLFPLNSTFFIFNGISLSYYILVTCPTRPTCTTSNTLQPTLKHGKIVSNHIIDFYRHSE